MKNIFVAVVFLIISTTASANDEFYVIGSSLLLADWAQTRYIVRNDEFYERNIILGKYPHSDAVDLYFTSMLVLYNVGGRKIADTRFKRVLWHGTLFLMQSWAIENNISLGVKMRF